MFIEADENDAVNKMNVEN